jgi:hypothetical protein
MIAMPVATNAACDAFIDRKPPHDHRGRGTVRGQIAAEVRNMLLFRYQGPQSRQIAP